MKCIMLGDDGVYSATKSVIVTEFSLFIVRSTCWKYEDNLSHCKNTCKIFPYTSISYGIRMGSRIA